MTCIVVDALPELNRLMWERQSIDRTDTTPNYSLTIQASVRGGRFR